VDDLFRPGGPHKIRKTGAHRDEFSITIPDADGMRAHECPDKACAPAYFKVRPGTGLTDQPEMYCPYCRRAGPSKEFFTEEQIRFANDQVSRETATAVRDTLARGLGLDSTGRKKIGGGLVSLEFSLKRGYSPPVRPPREEPLRRDIRCPHCTLDHAVFGLAIWCSDCGKDIFLVHLAAELDVLRAMLNAVPERREKLGRRVAARDVEDALENTVSVFEAVMKFITRQHLLKSGKSTAEITDVIRKKVGNGFQSIGRGSDLFKRLVGRDLLDGCAPEDVTFLTHAFEKRHPIAHNLGVVDRTYLERAVSAAREGREVTLYADEVRRALDLVYKAIGATYGALFTPPPQPLPTAPTSGVSHAEPDAPPPAASGQGQHQ